MGALVSQAQDVFKVDQNNNISVRSLGSNARLSGEASRDHPRGREIELQI